MSTSLSTRPKRRGALTAIVGIAALLLSGCSASSAETASSVPPAEDGAFPVSLEHVYGTTTIEEQPERVVTLGWISQDVVAALDVVPVAVTDSSWGTVDTYLPWFVDTVEELGGELPEVIAADDAGVYDFEQILSLAPDVILAPHSGITEKDYERLTEIAPTVAYQELAWTSDWADVTRTVGAALGQPAAAERLVEDTDANIEQHAAEHPEFQGVTFTYGWAWVPGDTQFGFYSSLDARERLIQQLGFETSPWVAERSETAEEFTVYESLEQIDTVDSDIYIGWANTQEELDAMVNQELIKRWEPIAAGKYYVMTEQGLAWASSAPSPLSIPWSLDIIVPALAEIVAK